MEFRAGVVAQIFILSYFFITIVFPIVTYYRRRKLISNERQGLENASEEHVQDILDLCLQSEIFYASFEK